MHGRNVFALEKCKIALEKLFPREKCEIYTDSSDYIW